MALCTGTPRWRIDELVTGQSLPAWDEVQLLAWHFKVPLSQLIGPIQRDCACRGPSVGVRPWITARDNATRISSLHTLASAHPNIFDVTFAQWPARLAPNLAECLATEVEILRIHEELLADADEFIREVLLDAILGIESRLQALSIRHSLRLHAPHSIDVHDLALGFEEAIAALNNTASTLRRLGSTATLNP